MDFINAKELLELCDKKNMSIAEIMKIRECDESTSSKEEIIKEKKEILLEKNELSFFEIAKQYILKTNNTIIGYTDKEIKIIEKMYEVKINGKLKKFLKNFGRSFGGLLTGKEIIFYNRR